MMRHILGEDLNVGCVLSWGPCWYYQKQFFEGAVHKLSTKDYIMRYDVEVSGFPSQHAGHLCLLRLKEDDYEYPQPVEFDWKFAGKDGHFKGTKTEQIGEWPTWDLPILKWGKEQGGVVGFSHSGWGLALPDYGPGENDCLRLTTRSGPAAAWPSRRQAARLCHAAVRRRIVGRDDMIPVGERRYKVAEHMRRRWKSMQQKHDGTIGGPGLAIENVYAVDVGRAVVGY